MCRLTLLLCLVALSAAGFSPAQASPSAEKPPNILVITTDDMGLQAGCYGDPLAVTPNLDQLAAQGVLFERGYTTQASCSPARASLLTGLYPHQNGQIGLAGQHPEYRVKDGIPTLPGLMKQAGYKSGILGKLHIAPGEIFPFDFSWPGDAQAKATRQVKTVAAKAAEFLDGPARDKPFFLYVNYFDPHRPFDQDAHQTEGLPAEPYTPEEVAPLAYLGMEGQPARAEATAYYNSIRRMDTGLGLLFAVLKDRGRWDNTLVFFVSDHGPPFTRAKTSVYEAGTHIPFVVRWPGVSVAGTRTEAFASIVDIMPTILDAVGIKPPDMAGRSLQPVLQGRTPENWPKLIFTEHTSHAGGHFFPRRAVRDQRHKLIHNLLPGRRNPVPYEEATRPGNKDNVVDPTFQAAYDTMEKPPEWELYDLPSDPFELNNLAAKTESRLILERLQAALQDWREQTADPLLDPRELERLGDAHAKN